MSTDNLDYHCAQCSEALATVDHSFINKALGVLQENGVYALVLFLMDRGTVKKQGGRPTPENLYAQMTAHALLRLWSLAPLTAQDTQGDPFPAALRAARDFSPNLDLLLLARDVTERLLVYGRYHARAHVE